MALVSNIQVDLAARTAILTSTVNNNSVELISYVDSNLQITFNSRADINISFSEFIDFVNQVNILQTAILFNFSPNVFASIPFGSCNNTENHDSVLNKWNLVCIYGASPRVCNYSYDKATTTLTMANRASSKILEFPEWLYFLNQLNHYKTSVKQF